MWTLWYLINIIVKIKVDLIVWWNFWSKVDYIYSVYIDYDIKTQEWNDVFINNSSKKQSQHTHNKSWKRALHARQNEFRERSNNNELHKLQQCKFEDDCKWCWHVTRKQRREVATLMQRRREDNWHYWSTNKDINIREKDEQRLFIKRNSTEADASSSTWIRRKTSHDSECIHRKECIETEDISSTAKQAVTNVEKYTSLIRNHVMSKRDKRRIINERATSQRRVVITLQKMWSHDKDSRQRRNKEDAEEDRWANSSENSRRVNESTKSDCVSLQAE